MQDGDAPRREDLPQRRNLCDHSRVTPPGRRDSAGGTARRREEEHHRDEGAVHSGRQLPWTGHSTDWSCCTHCAGLAPRMDFVLEKASVLCYRLYDVADKIDLGVAESAIARAPAACASVAPGRNSFSSQSTADYRAWAAAAGPPPRAGGGRGARAAVRLRGDLHRPHRARVRGNGLGRADAARGRALRRPAVDALALELIETLRKDVAPALEARTCGSRGELHGHLRRGNPGRPLRGGGDRKRDLARLLLGERGAGALAAERAGRDPAPLQLPRGRPRGHRLEQRLRLRALRAAGHPRRAGDRNAQLLELRYYDDLLDATWPASTTRLQRKRRGWVVASSAARTRCWRAGCWSPCWR